MSLKKLFGPVTLTTGEGNPITALRSSIMMWVPSMGVGVCYTDSTGNYVGVVSLDGVVESVGTFKWNCVGWDYVNSCILDNEDVEYRLDYRSFARIPEPTTVDVGGNLYYIRMKDRYLVLEGGDIKVHGSTEVECVTGLGGPFQGIGVGLNFSEVFLFESHPLGSPLRVRCRFYAPATRVLASDIMYIPFSAPHDCALIYSPEFNVIISIDSSTFEYNVWSLEVVSASISVPYLKSGSTSAGNVAVYGVTVTGDHGEL